MKARILPTTEWPRLVGTEAETVWPHLDPARTSIVVVEHDGAIVGCHVLSWLLHAECLWIHPDHRGRSSVARRLWASVKQTARDVWHAHAIVTGACDDRVRALLQHVGAEPLPGEMYVIRMEQTSCLPS